MTFFRMNVLLRKTLGMTVMSRESPSLATRRSHSPEVMCLHIMTRVVRRHPSLSLSQRELLSPFPLILPSSSGNLIPTLYDSFSSFDTNTTQYNATKQSEINFPQQEFTFQFTPSPGEVSVHLPSFNSTT